VPEEIKLQQGQGMVEYLFIVLLVAFCAIAAFSVFGQTVRGQTGQMSVQVSGGEGSGLRSEAVGRHCCGVRGNPPSPAELPNGIGRAAG